MSEQLSLFEPRQHAHLRVAAATEPGRRKTRRAGWAGSTTYSDRRAHARDIDTQISAIKASHKRRSASLGISPELVLVLETNGPLDPVLAERAGLILLEVRSDRALIAFATDPDLTEFLSRNEQYAEGTRGLTASGNESSAKYEDLFDRIDTVRAVEENDLIGAGLQALLASNDSLTEIHRLEIHCWCPEDASEARRRNNEVATAIRNAQGTVLDQSVRAQAGWSAICCARA